MGSSTNKTTSTSGPSNPDLNATVSKLAKGLGSEYTQGKSLYQAPGANTQAGWAAQLGAAGNQDFAGGLAGAIGSYGNRAAGNELGMNDPGYAALRSKLQNDVTTGVNSSFNNSGLFGSDSNVKSLSSGLADSLGALDYQQYNNSLNRQSEAANLLPQLFSGAQLPSSIQQSVGASMDADKAAQANGKIDYLNRILAPLTGASGAAGTAQTTTNTPDPWRLLLGGGLGLAGLL